MNLQMSEDSSTNLEEHFWCQAAESGPQWSIIRLLLHTVCLRNVQATTWRSRFCLSHCRHASLWLAQLVQSDDTKWCYWLSGSRSSDLRGRQVKQLITVDIIVSGSRAPSSVCSNQSVGHWRMNHTLKEQKLVFSSKAEGGAEVLMWSNLLIPVRFTAVFLLTEQIDRWSNYQVKPFSLETVFY